MAIFNKKPLPQKDMRDLYNMTKQLKDAVGLIWLTMVGYIIYVEFYKDIISIL